MFATLRRTALTSINRSFHASALATAPLAPSAAAGFSKIAGSKAAPVIRRVSSSPAAVAQATVDKSAFPSAVSFENELASNTNSAGVDAGTQAFKDESPLVEDLSRSFKGVSHEPFPEEVSKVLNESINLSDIEVKPDGMLYIPEIKYRRILNKAFGPGGWGLVPRGPHTVNNKNISREYALFCLGRFVSQARGEQDFFGEDSLPTASEGCKSNALMRCCKDLGIHWELWDPVFIRKFKAEHATMAMGVHVSNGIKKYLWRLKTRTLDYPYKEDTSGSKGSTAAPRR